jgi:hypothetical protein
MFEPPYYYHRQLCLDFIMLNKLNNRFTGAWSHTITVVQRTADRSCSNIQMYVTHYDGEHTECIIQPSQEWRHVR